MPDRNLLEAIASAFLAGGSAAPELVERGSFAVGGRRPWLVPLVKRYVDTFGGGRTTRPRHCDVLAFLANDAGLRRSRIKLSTAQLIARGQSAKMWPAWAARLWNVPVLETAVDLADWLALAPGDLEWFADLRHLTQRRDSPRLSHYRYRVITKASGRPRLLEAPKRTTKLLQRQILRRILEQIPPHPSAHGFVRGRSIKTFVAPHIGQVAVLRMDLAEFFPSITRARIQALFRTMGYPEPVADLFGGICTNAAPPHAWGDVPPAHELYSKPHLPQGAPTSPTLANLCAWRLDQRLTGLAAAAGASYTRYADDLAFSGGVDFARQAERFSTHTAVIVKEEGFAVNHRKTRIMRQGVRQHLTGLVTNELANVPRPEFDRLKAILTNCLRYGLESENRENHPAFLAHLTGRVGFFEAINPAKAKRLRAILERIPPAR